MPHYSDPPVLLRNVIENVDDVVDLLASQAPYTPLGGWYDPGADPDARTRPMWFQNDWVHDTFRAPGSDLFLQHPRYIEAAKSFYDAEVIEPHSVYVNIMTTIDSGGPAHTDNPRFDGRDRANTPMWLLRAMLWSELFQAYEIVQATAIWWLDDVEGGALRYWPDGPESPPTEHGGDMANTALLGDNHGMFHQVGPVGPFDRGTPLVTPRAELGPVGAPAGDWAIVDRGETVHRAPLDTYRVSVLWKANVYATPAEQQRRSSGPGLSLQDVADIFNEDLTAKGAGVRLRPDELVDASPLQAELAKVYPEARPIDTLASVYDRS